MKGRSSPRFPVEYPVSCEFRRASVQMTAVNISRTGLLLTGPELLPVGAVVNLRFAVAAVGEIEIKGLVRHVVSGCGMEFVEVLPEQQLRLCLYLDKVEAAAAGAGT